MPGLQGLERQADPWTKEEVKRGMNLLNTDGATDGVAIKAFSEGGEEMLEEVTALLNRLKEKDAGLTGLR